MKNYSKTIFFGCIVFFSFFLFTASNKNDEILIDIEGNIYYTIKIGDELWMRANLRTSKLNDGREIPMITDNTEWSNLTTPGHCWPNNDSSSFLSSIDGMINWITGIKSKREKRVSRKDIYGALYNWYSINTGKLCPCGWHVPSDIEWGRYIEEVYGKNDTIPMSKDSHNRISGVLLTQPSGYRGEFGSFYGIDYQQYWWSSSESDDFYSWERDLNITQGDFINRNTSLKQYGLSVRCIKDNRNGLYESFAPKKNTNNGSINKKKSESENISNDTILKDVDGNSYQTILLGKKIWMKSNLRTTKLNDSTPILLTSNNKEWPFLSVPGYCIYNNRNYYDKNCGLLYNWLAVDSHKLCPSGWHVPTKLEWSSMINSISKSKVESDELESKFQELNSRDIKRFAGFSCGYRKSNGTYNNNDYYGYWWSSTEFDTYESWIACMFSGKGQMRIQSAFKELGFSVRCVKD
jgi:uncharacterized protein (TIGR02145 family)